MDVDSLKAQLTMHDQDHLLQFWDTLCEEDRKNLYASIKEIDFDEVTSYFERAMQNIDTTNQKLDDIMQPLSTEQYGSVSRTDTDTLKSYNNEGRWFYFSFSESVSAV